MFWWLLVATVLIAVLVAAVAAVTLMYRFRHLSGSLRRVAVRGEEAQRLQAKVVDLQERAEQLQDRVQAIAALRHDEPDPTPAAGPIADAR